MDAVSFRVLGIFCRMISKYDEVSSVKINHIYIEIPESHPYSSRHNDITESGFELIESGFELIESDIEGTIKYVTLENNFDIVYERVKSICERIYKTDPANNSILEQAKNTTRDREYEQQVLKYLPKGSEIVIYRSKIRLCSECGSAVMLTDSSCKTCGIEFE